MVMQVQRHGMMQVKLEWRQYLAKITFCYHYGLLIHHSLKVQRVLLMMDLIKPSYDNGKKVDENPRKDSEGINQEKKDNVNSTNNVRATSTNGVNAVGANSSIELLFDLEMPKLEDISTFNFSNEDEYDGAEADMNNMNTTIQVSPTPTIRIHKDHPLDQVIGDVQLAIQTRNMSKNLEEH
ncbi:hypothetical protein Tco_0570382, partial [Tanacetum coccineum]